MENQEYRERLEGTLKVSPGQGAIDVVLYRLEALDRRFDRVDGTLQNMQTRTEVQRERNEERFDKIETEQARVRTWGTMGLLIATVVPGFILKLWR